MAVESVAGKTGVVTLDSSDVGLGDVDNTSDAEKQDVFDERYYQIGEIVFPEPSNIFDGGFYPPEDP
jgi:hypothetical protein